MSQASDYHLAVIRRVLATFLKDTCTIQKPSLATDEGGNQHEIFVNNATNVACRMLPVTRLDSQGEVGEMEQGRAQFELIVPYDTEIRDGWRVIHEGKIYQFVQLFDTFTDNVDKRVLLSRLGNG